MAAKDETLTVKDAVHKLQLALLHGVQSESLLFSAGTLMSRGDYDDVVTERSIVNLCGYPLCANNLPSERPRKGRYRISLKEHKVYDLHETYLYCSPSCVVNSRVFAGTLKEERCAFASPAKIDQILRSFGDSAVGLESSEEGLGKNGDLGFSQLRIQEKPEVQTGEVSMQDWVGPSNAIEGYVPQINRTAKPSSSRARKKTESKSSGSKAKETFFNGMDFMSTIITNDEYSISKTPGSANTLSKTKLNESEVKAPTNDTAAQSEELETTSLPMKNGAERKPRESEVERSGGVAGKEELGISEVSSRPCESSIVVNHMEGEDVTSAARIYQTSETMRKSSLKSSRVKKQARSVTWADEKTDSVETKNLCEVREMDVAEVGEELDKTDVKDDNDLSRFTSAEACAVALSEAAEAIASGESDASDAVSEAGIIILPNPHDLEESQSQEESDADEPQMAPVKWPKKPGTLQTDFVNSEDSWYDAPPEGFNLTLSPFATMWNALFTWMTSSSLAYIYGGDESTHEDYLSINGREYPRKVVLSDGRSSEIKQTLAGCLARALPALVADLRLPTPLSTMEQGLGRLLDTMSFMDAIPSFRMKQWQVVTLVFLEALSVCRIPALAPHMTSRRLLLHKVLDGAQLSMEDYDVMKDIVIPLGRVPHFSSQRGG